MTNLLKKFGVTAAPAQQFEPVVAGRTVLVDGDSLCYQVTAKCAKLETALRRLAVRVYEIMYLTNASTARVHLTPDGCFKNGRRLLKTVKPYQGQRKNKDKPTLLEPLRQVAPENFRSYDDITVESHLKYEADDAIMIDAYRVPNAVVWSEDKDLMIAPCPIYMQDTGTIHTLPVGTRYGFVEAAYTPAGSLKFKGHGTKVFWLQMLCGDQADHVVGLTKYEGKNCGIDTGLKALAHIEDENHAANLVLNAYREINQNPLPEAECLWLLRAEGDSALNYIWDLELTDRNRDFIYDCSTRDYRLAAEEDNLC